MSDINKIMIIGRITQAPEFKKTPGGSGVCNFSIANTRTYKVGEERKEYTNFFNCQAWGKLAETIAKYCVKGQQIAIDGRLQHRTWTDKSGGKRSTVDIVLDGFQFLAKPNGAGKPAQNQPEYVPPPSFDDAMPMPDEDIPF
jgi:single-strand DNA-binding protein